MPDVARRDPGADPGAASAAKLIDCGRKDGLVLLREDGWDKVRAGLTTPEEILRVTKAG